MTGIRAIQIEALLISDADEINSPQISLYLKGHNEKAKH